MPAKTVVLEMELPSAANLRENHFVRAKRTNLQRRVATAAGKEAVTLPTYTVTLHRVGKRRLDDDNLQSAFKAMRDGVADALEMKDNNPRIRWVYEQSTGSKCEVRITVEAV